MILLALLVIGLAGCLPSATPLPPLPTDTPGQPSVTPTPTIVWFPVTPTYTVPPGVTLQPTPTTASDPARGTLIFADQFDDPQAWSLGRGGGGQAALGVNELTLAVQRPSGYVSSLRRATELGDFYLEITAAPTICRGGDEYGLLLRVGSEQDFYRFSLTCDGQARVDKLFQGGASSPQPLTPNAAIPRGAPSSTRLSVLATGDDLYFYANGEYLFTVRDPSLFSGAIGVFARAAGEDPVTVNFSDLQVYRPAG